MCFNQRAGDAHVTTWKELDIAGRKRRPLETVVEFIEQQPMTWAEFERWRAGREHDRHLAFEQAIRQITEEA